MYSNILFNRHLPSVSSFSCVEVGGGLDGEMQVVGLVVARS